MDCAATSVVAVLPYFPAPNHTAIPIFGAFNIQLFGVLVATGVLVGAWVARKRTDYLMMDQEEVRSLIIWILVGGFLGAHVFDTLFYQWGRLKEDPLLLLKIWEGISSYGGFIGGFLGYLGFLRWDASVRGRFPFAWVSFRRREQPVEDKLGFADIIGWGLLVGFTFGRMGCTLVHDHPGKPSHFFLAVDYPASRGRALMGPRYDLGLYELLFLLFLIFVIVVVARGWHRRTGFVLGFSTIAYGGVRFFLDYLRLNDHDPRYAGLTFAQYVSVATLLGGVVIMWHVYHRTPPAPAVAPPDDAPRKPSAKPASVSHKKKAKSKKRRR